MNLNFNDNNFFIEDQASKDRKLNHMDLQLVFQDFAFNHNGKFIIANMFTGVDVNNGYDCATKCVCSSGKCILLGSIGTFLSTTLALTVGVATATIAAIIFVTLAAFFFVVMLVSVVSLISCLIKETCR